MSDESENQPESANNSKQEQNKTEDKVQSKKKTAKKPGPLDVVFSVLSAMIGVQSEANRERDFSKGDIGNYIFVGIVMVVIFIFTLIHIVNNILEDAAK